MLMVRDSRESCEQGEEKGAQYQSQLQGRVVVKDTNTGYVELHDMVCVIGYAYTMSLL